AVGTIDCGSAAPMALAPSWAPLNEYSLKFLSLRVPMSVTTPILRSAAAGDAAGALPAGHGTAAGAAELAPALALALPDGALVAVVPPHALRTSVSPTSA